MATTECKVDGCTRLKVAQGWCNLHYRRWKRSGDPLKAAWERGDSVANFWAKVRRGADDECWPWTGSISEDGYPSFLAGGHRLAHRFAYALLVGPIPDGLELDHTCHSRSGCTAAGRSCPHRRCVNALRHLEPVSHLENAQRVCDEARRRRSTKVAAMHSAKTHCPHGHEYTAENTYVDKRGSRNCRECRREKDRRLNATADRATYQREYKRRRKAEQQT